MTSSSTSKPSDGVPVRFLPFPIEDYGPSRINALFEIPKEYVGDTNIKTYYNIIFKQVWDNVHNDYPTAKITGSPSKYIEFTCESTDPIASYKIALVDINIWVRNSQILIELIVLTDHAMGQEFDKIFKETVMKGMKEYTTVQMPKLF